MSRINVENIRHPDAGADSVSLDLNGNVNIDSGTLYVAAGNNRVGIGTASPARQFTIYDSAVPIIQLVNSTTGDTVNDGVMLYESGSDFIIENQEAGEIKIYNNGTERVKITSDGVLQTTNGVQLNKYNSIANNVKLVVVTGDGGSNTVQTYWNLAVGSSKAGGCLGAYKAGTYASPATSISPSNTWAIYGFIDT